MMILAVLLFSIAAKSQKTTAYEYYFINKNLGSKDVYRFTSAKASTYIKGSSYVFASAEFEKSTNDIIEEKRKK